MMHEEQRTVLDVSALPRHPFGPSQITWWGNLGFMVIEGTTLLIFAVTYLYLRRNFQSWPPAGTPPPDLLVPTLSLIALLGSAAISHLEGKAAKEKELSKVRVWAISGVVISVFLLILRAMEFSALNTRWDTDAYGSILWFIVGFHGTLLLLQFLEDTLFVLVAFLGPVEPDYFPHVAEKAEYGYFIAGIWIPIWILIYLGPRFL